MTIITTYIADDGKKFDDEWDCAEYERTLRSNQFKDTAFLFDDKGNQLPLSEAGFEDSVFILCKTDEAAKYLFEELNSGYCLPWGYDEEAKAGAWIFNNGDKWVKLEDFLSLARVAIRISEL